MPDSFNLKRRDFFVRIALGIAAIVILSNLTAAFFFTLRFNSLNTEQRQQIAQAIAEGRSPEAALRVPSPFLMTGPFTLVVPVGLGLLLAWGFSLRLARPIERINRAAADLSAGKLDTRINLEGQIGEFRLVATTLNQVAESLERLENERKSMIADIAHELRTPLTAIRTRLEGLEDGLLEFTPGEVQKLQYHTLLLSRLIEDLRTLSLADAGQLSLKKRPVDLADLLESTLEGFEARAREKGVQLEEEAAPIHLEADPERLTQVISNLVDNALRYTPRGGSVKVSVENLSSGIKLSVQDSGPGIPEEALPYVFDRFYRGDSSRSRDTGGSGLGLAIVRALVQLHGGQVSVKNAQSGGAVFEIRLPSRV
ncbi:MAG: ATP-binding protein [Meiothermus sp.]|nr:ATP-binding protein [Meiothermus sp.]